jgi:hypothetical protein
MLELNGFQAWVTVDGVELDQYSVETSPDKKLITCWIACEQGKVCGNQSPSSIRTHAYFY